MPFFKKHYKLLLIDEDEKDFIKMKEYLNQLPFRHNIDWVSSYENGLDEINKDLHDIYLVDYEIESEKGIELIKEACENGCKKPIILLTEETNKAVDIKALKAGAADYFSKQNLNLENLEGTLRRAIQRYEYNLIYKDQLAIFKSYFNQSFAPLFIVDENFVLMDANQSFHNHFSEEETHQSLEKIFYKKEEFTELKEKALSEKYIENNLSTLIDVKGRERIVLISISPVFDKKKLLHGYQGIINDITQVHKAEKELALAQQVNMTNRMARIMAHEVRNPLTNISLAADQLLDELPPDSDEVEYVEIIKRNSERINKLIGDLLNTTRKSEIKLEPTYIEDTIEYALSLIEDRIVLKDIELFLSIDKKKKTKLDIDAEKITMVLINIFTNAIEAMDAVDNKKLNIECYSNKDYFSIKISDSGIGMNEETKENLFEPFYTKRSGGMGLGMTTVKNIIAMHDAKIYVESELGKGSNFIIQFNKKQKP